MPATLMICLIGEQAIPNVLGVLLARDRPHRVVCLVSEDTRWPRSGRTDPRYTAVYSGIHACLSRLPEPVTDVRMRLVLPFDVDSTRQAIHELVEQEFPDDTIVVNLTGGTKLMAQGAFRACADFWESEVKSDEPSRVSALYVDTQESHIIHWDNSGTEHDPARFDAERLGPLDVHGYLLAYGVTLRHAGDRPAIDDPLVSASDVLATARGGIEIARLIAATKPTTAGATAVITLFAGELDSDQRGILERVVALSGGAVEVRNEQSFVRLVVEGHDWQRLFWGRRWLEYHVYAETVRAGEQDCAPAIYSDVRMNATVDWNGIARLARLMVNTEDEDEDEETLPPISPVINELDVVARRGARLLVCECKTDKLAPKDKHLYKLQVIGVRAGTYTDRLLVIAPEPGGESETQRLRALAMDIGVVNLTTLRDNGGRLRSVLEEPENYLRDQQRDAKLLAW